MISIKKIAYINELICDNNKFLNKKIIIINELFSTLNIRDIRYLSSMKFLYSSDGYLYDRSGWSSEPSLINK